MDKIYHAGERKIQQMFGEEQIANRNGRIIKNKIVKGAFNFIEKQPIAIVSSTDKAGNIWTSLLVGQPGFLRINDEVSLNINCKMLRSARADIFYENIKANPQIGMLFIELATRGRYRVNGQAAISDDGIEISVHEAYPNCPKYIQRRVITFPDLEQVAKIRQSEGTNLEESEKVWICHADTFFVGSTNKGGRMDASHRGGVKGFVEILKDGTLKIPDYIGNSMYNTLGNFLENPNAGLVFVDFQKGNTLQLTGKAKLLFDQNTPTQVKPTIETGRYWLFRTEQWIRVDNHHQANWEFIDFSPFNP